MRIGTIGWNFPEWRGLIYPAEARPEQFLGHYAEHFPLVEVSASYYRFPDRETVDSWNEQTPRGFTLSLKVPDWITRSPADKDAPGKLDAFVERVAPLRDAGKLGALVAQFPPFFRRDKREADLRTFVESLPAGPDWAVELRHRSWWHESTYALLREAGVTLVWSSVESGRTPPVATSDRLYLRLFGDHSLAKPYDHKQRDATDELSWWVDRLHDEGAGAKRIDVLISKFLEGYAPGTAATLCSMLGMEAPDVGPREGRKTTRQTRLAGF